MLSLVKKNLPLLLIIVAGLIFRVFGLFITPVSFDEAHNVLLSRSNDFISMMKSAEGYPPLFFLLLHYWQLLSINLWFIRSLSILFGAATIPMIAYVGKEIFDKETGLIAALLVALSPSLVFYSSIARMYSLAILIAVIITYIGALCLKRTNKNISYLIFILIGLYTHYYFVIFWICSSLYIFLYHFRKIKLLAPWFITNILIAAGFLPAIILVLTSNFPVAVPSNSLYKWPFFYVSSVIPWDYLQTLSIVQSYQFDLISVITLIILFISWTFYILSNLFIEKRSARMFFCFVYFVSPALIFLISYLITPSAALRSFIIFSPFFFLLVAYWLAHLPSRLRFLILTPTLILWLIFFFQYNILQLRLPSNINLLYSYFNPEDVVVYNDVILYLPSLILFPKGTHILSFPGYLDEITINTLQIKLIEYESIPKSNKIWYVRQLTNWPPYENNAIALESKIKHDYIEKKRINFYQYYLSLYAR